MPKLIDSQFSVKQNAKIVQNEVLITYIEPNSPAANAGLKADDQLIQIGGLNSNLVTVTDANNLPTLTKSFAGQQVRVVYKHAGKVNSSVVTLLSQSQVQKNLNNNTPKGYLGVEPISYTLTRYTWSAPIVALGMMKQLTVLTFKGLASVVASLYHGNTAKASSQVTGPVGIFFLLQNGSRLGFEFILIIIAVISLTLAIMNVLPIPALDGGRLFVTLITRMFRHPIKQKTEEWIHGLGFMVLMFLIVLITVGDVKKYF
jgi:regulator of sigma E protease